MSEKYFSGRLHDETLRRLQALKWLETNPQPNKKKDNAGYWKWWRTYHFAMNDDTWCKFVQRTRKPIKRTVPQKRSASSGHPAYRQPGHPMHEEYLSHARAYEAKRRQEKKDGPST